jgi:GntR family transcriptional regulator
VIPFRIQLRPGASISEQIIYAAKRAIVSGQLQPGDPFPSGPGIGTVVAALPGATQRARRDLLTRQIEPLIVEAKLLSLTREDVLEAVAEHFQNLTQPKPNASSGERHR